MLTEEQILNKLKELFGRPKDLTVFLALTDRKDKPDITLPKNKNLVWSEPADDVYLINLPLLLMFKPNLDSIQELFQEIIDSGFEVESKRFSIPAKTKLLDIAVITDNTSIAIVSMFSPKGLANYWEQFLIDVELPEHTLVDVVFGDNTGSDWYKEWFASFKERMSSKYNGVYRADLGEPKLIEDDTYFNHTNKHAHVAKNYSKLLASLADAYDYILVVEDDVEPPATGLIDLYSHMRRLDESGEKVACVAGCYPQRTDPTTVCISLRPKVWGKVPKLKDVKPKLFKVEMQGGGFSLYDTRAIKKVLPYRLVFKTLNGNYYMTGWDGYIGEEWSKLGWKQYCDGSILCNHHF